MELTVSCAGEFMDAALMLQWDVCVCVCVCALCLYISGSYSIISAFTPLKQGLPLNLELG